MSQLAKLPLKHADLVRLIKEAAADSANVFFSEHAQERLVERDISTTEVIDCLRHGRIQEGPAQSPRGNWEFKVSRYCSGQSISVVGALELDEDGNHIIVITTYRG